MSEIGALIIRLQAETAQFREDMGKVNKDLDDLKDKGKDIGDAMDHSFAEGRGGLMLTGDLYRYSPAPAVTSFIASLAPVGAAMEAAFPFLAMCSWCQRPYRTFPPN